MRDLLERRLGIDVRAKNPVNLLIRLLEHFRVLEHGVDRAGQKAAGGLMARDQECIDLITDVDVVELLAGRLVHARHHGVEHVLGAGSSFRILAALGDDFVDHLVHERDVFRQRRAACAHEQVFERKPTRHHDRLERAHECADEGVIILPIERIETIIEPAETDGVER